MLEFQELETIFARRIRRKPLRRQPFLMELQDGITRISPHYISEKFKPLKFEQLMLH